MGNPVVHFEIIGKDGEATRKYYSELFGWKIDANNPMSYGLIDAEDNPQAEGIGIGGGVAGGYGGDGYVTVYVEVPDVEASLRQAESLGGTRVMGPEDVPGAGILGQFKDPDGHVIGLIQA